MWPRGKQIMAPPPHPLAVSIDKRLGELCFAQHTWINSFGRQILQQISILVTIQVTDTYGTSLFSYLELKIVGTKGHLWHIEIRTWLFIKWLTITFPKDKYISIKILDPGIWQILLLRLVFQFFCDLLRQKKWYFLVEKIYFLRSRIRFLDSRLTKWHHHSLKGSGFLSVRKYISRPDLSDFLAIGKN